MHTETNLCEGPRGDEAVHWLRKEWANVLRVRNNGVPLVGFTWYSLIDQVDWDSALREDNGNVNALGLFDLTATSAPSASPTMNSCALDGGPAHPERVPASPDLMPHEFQRHVPPPSGWPFDDDATLAPRTEERE